MLCFKYTAGVCRYVESVSWRSRVSVTCLLRWSPLYAKSRMQITADMSPMWTPKVIALPLATQVRTLLLPSRVGYQSETFPYRPIVKELPQ
jgi:hypothetical protein